MNVKRTGQLILAGAVLALASSGAVAGIANTKHNLSSSGPTSQFSGTAEICVFCHTPHGADTSANPPLWNRVLPAGNTFTTYNSLGTSTLDGEVLTVGSVSIACLSCHDGTQAMNVMINAPGSGNYAVNGFNLNGTWTGAVAGTGTLAGLGDNVNLGKDLQNDHPIGIEYGGGGCRNGTTAAGSECTSAMLNDKDFKSAKRAANGFWYVDVDSDSSREKTDMILYTRAFTTGTAGDGPSVECASCHDPHSETNATFLRISNAGSAVCLACHTK